MGSLPAEFELLVFSTEDGEKALTTCHLLPDGEDYHPASPPGSPAA